MGCIIPCWTGTTLIIPIMDMFHPMRDNEAYKGMQHNFDNYLDYLHGQVEELCTTYGKIDLFWFDFSYEIWREIPGGQRNWFR